MPRSVTLADNLGERLRNAKVQEGKHVCGIARTQEEKHFNAKDAKEDKTHIGRKSVGRKSEAPSADCLPPGIFGRLPSAERPMPKRLPPDT
jgi:hypothetical protein